MQISIYCVEIGRRLAKKRRPDGLDLVAHIGHILAEQIAVDVHTGSVQIEQAGSVGDVSTHTGKVSITGDVTGKVSTHVGSVYVNGKMLPKR